MARTDKGINCTQMEKLISEQLFHKLNEKSHLQIVKKYNARLIENLTPYFSGINWLVAGMCCFIVFRINHAE